jgi:hypothetical protein
MRAGIGAALVMVLAAWAGSAAAQEPSLCEATRETGEEKDEVEPDRSAFTPATSTVGRNRLLLELSGSYLDFRSGPGKYSYPELLARYGLTDRFEARFGYNLESNGKDEPELVGTDVAGTILGVGTTQFGYGFKWQATDQDGWLPRSGFVVQGYTPINGETLTSEVAAGYVFGWVLPNGWRFDSGFRFNTNRFEGDGYSVWANTHVLRVPLTDRLGTNVEYFGLYSSDKDVDFVRPYFSNGYTFLATPGLELGLRVGVALNRQSPPFFVNAGFGWRY